jgi:hypothetical protein
MSSSCCEGGHRWSAEPSLWLSLSCPCRAPRCSACMHPVTVQDHCLAFCSVMPHVTCRRCNLWMCKHAVMQARAARLRVLRTRVRHKGCRRICLCRSIHASQGAVPLRRIPPAARQCAACRVRHTTAQGTLPARLQLATEFHCGRGCGAPAAAHSPRPCPVWGG